MSVMMHDLPTLNLIYCKLHHHSQHRHELESAVSGQQKEATLHSINPQFFLHNLIFLVLILDVNS
jgi:hypothetical protein